MYAYPQRLCRSLCAASSSWPLDSRGAILAAPTIIYTNTEMPVTINFVYAQVTAMLYKPVYQAVCYCRSHLRRKNRLWRFYVGLMLAAPALLR
jgi:hypothetical protein